MNNGFQNEYDFVELYNNKYMHELNNDSQRFIKELFNDEINDNEIYIAWKNRINQKTDIFIKHNNYIKNISIKLGSNNSIHSETIQDFKLYLEKLNIPYKIRDYYINYHYGYRRNENNKLDFSINYSSEEYKEFYQKELDEFNRYMNKTRIIIDMIDRFIIRGRNSEYDIDAFIVGTTNDYVWILKDDIYDLILSKRDMVFTSPHIACLTIGPKARNLNNNPALAKSRYIVCIRWNFIKEHIIEFKNNKLSKSQ